MKWHFDNTYTRLPAPLFTRINPTPVTAPRLIVFNELLAADLGLGPLHESEDTAILAGNLIAPGSEPIAQAYAGHQFAHFTRLGDGRAHLLGEHVTPDGRRFDIQLKGSGPTPYSRRGDGRAALKPMLREFLISEAMFYLNIPTTRSLAVVATGEPVFRETVQKGAVLTRMASSHIRVGTFEYAARLEDREILKALQAYTVERHQLGDDFVATVAVRQAALIAKWLAVGFIHGVMNTDNMAVSGETIDYGPCAFMDTYDPATVYSSIDRQGRYAYGRQPQIALWNLARLAETVLAPEEIERVLNVFKIEFDKCWLNELSRKLGFADGSADLVPLIERLMQWMYKSKADFTGTFRALAEPEPLSRDEDFLTWHRDWRELLRQAGREDVAPQEMKKVNPAIIPRNHAVEKALDAAEEKDDFSLFQTLVTALRDPFSDGPHPEELTRGPRPGEEVDQTFCGT